MDLLKKENVQIVESATDWKDAIRISVQPLEQHGYVSLVTKKKSYPMWNPWVRTLFWLRILHYRMQDQNRV